MDGRQAGLTGNGRTNDGPALQRLVDRLGTAGGGTIRLPAGHYLIQDAPIAWRSGVGLVGAGPGRTVIQLSNGGDRSRSVPFVFNIAETGTSVEAPLRSVTFDNFELDGSDVLLDHYDLGAKGFNIQYMVGARFSRLYVHDTVASGIGCDFLQSSVITGCVAERCGRGNDGTQPGGAGIGIGVGGYPPGKGGSWDVLDLLVEDCTTNDNGTHGIFFEAQSAKARFVQSRGVTVTGHVALRNRYGISDWGCDGLVTRGCRAEDNRLDGFNTGHGVGGAGTGGRRGSIVDCTLEANQRSGWHVGDPPPGGYAATGCTLSSNRGAGLEVAGRAQSAGSPGVTCSTSTLSGNGGPGVLVTTGVDSLAVTHCTLDGNGTDSSLPNPQRSGIALLATVASVTINGNTILGGQPRATQTWGVYTTPGNRSQLAAATTGNSLRGNLMSPAVGVGPG